MQGLGADFLISWQLLLHQNVASSPSSALYLGWKFTLIYSQYWFTASNPGLDLSRAAAAFGEAAAVEISSCDAGCIPTAAANFKAGRPKTAGAVQMAQQLHDALHVPDGRMNKMLWQVEFIQHAVFVSEVYR